ncbi:LTA synthase family protein [Candidatus Saccharibacteria bacterium]|nr:LTA synthase family protein [Candidatus Saccharibacteria bacterium]
MISENPEFSVNKKNHKFKSFFANQSIVLILAVTTFAKLLAFNTSVLRVTWPFDQYLDGVVMSFATCLLLFSPLLLINKYKNHLAIILASLASTLILIDAVYFLYFSSLPSVGLLAQIGQTGDVSSSIAGLIKWWMALLFVDIALLIIFRKFFASIKHRFEKPSRILSLGAVATAIVVFIVSGIWVGTTKLNDVFNEGYDTVSTAQYYGVFLAHTIDITRFIHETTVSLSEQEKQAVNDWVRQHEMTSQTNEYTGLAKGKNIIMLQVESLGSFVINQQINGKAITPNLDQLSKTTEFFPNDRFKIGAGHTSDTDFVVNSSYFPLNDAAVFVRYGHDDFTGLPKLFTKNGYSANVYHGFNRNFWNRDIAVRSLGYQNFYAADNYPKGEIINMGLNDGDFLARTADYIKDQAKPSLSHVITLTSHVPFSITDTTRGLDINPSLYPNGTAGYLEDINYTDRMIGKFFDKLKTNGLYEDSLIVIFGDHTPVLPSFSAGTINYDNSSNQAKEVPLFIKLPNSTVGNTHASQGTHLDIMPTILDLAGIKTNQLMFGTSLFATDRSVCEDQLSISTSRDCRAAVSEAENYSAKIIRYNLFKDLPN